MAMGNDEFNNEEAKRRVEQTFAFSVFPLDMARRNVGLGFKLMSYYKEHNCYIPIFAATDTISAVIGSRTDILPTIKEWPQFQDDTFCSIYGSYIDYINFLINNQSIQKIKYDFSHSGHIHNGFLAQKLLFKSLANPFLKLSHLCPFVRSWDDADFDEYETVRCNDLNINDEQDDMEREDAEILFALFKPEKCEKMDINPYANVSAKDSHLSLLIDIIGDKIRRKLHHCMNSRKSDGYFPPSPPEHPSSVGDSLSLEMLHECIRYQHILNYNLINLYLKYYDTFEPSEHIRRKIALIDLLSRTAIKRTPHNSAYEKPKNNGQLIPSYIIFPDYLLYTMILEGKCVFFGNDELIYDQYHMCICFHHIEDILMVTEKTGFATQVHHTLHKLMMSLVMHDLVKYLGKITNMNIDVQYHTYRLGHDADRVGGTNEDIRINDIHKMSRMDEPFMLQYDKFRKSVLKEPELLELAQKPYGSPFFKQFMDEVKIRTGKSYIANRFDFFMGQQGMFIGDKIHKGFNEFQNKEHLQQKTELAASMGLLGIQNQERYRVSPFNSNAFVIETGGGEIVLASGNQSNFVSRFFSRDLSECLTNLRDGVLEILLDNILVYLQNNRMSQGIGLK